MNAALDPIFENMLNDFNLKVEDAKKICNDLLNMQQEAAKMQTDLNYLHSDINNLTKSMWDYMKEQQLKQESMIYEKSKSVAFKELDILKLNIGGQIFSTFKSTVTKKIPNAKKKSNEFYEPNLLEKMINDEIEVIHDESNCIFIDRSPKYFNYVLDYLRIANTSQELNLPKNKAFLKDLLNEARFYNVNGLKYLVKDFNNEIVHNQQKITNDQGSNDSGNDVVAAKQKVKHQASPNNNNINRIGSSTCADNSKLDSNILAKNVKKELNANHKDKNNNESESLNRSILYSKENSTDYGSEKARSNFADRLTQIDTLKIKETYQSFISKTGLSQKVSLANSFSGDTCNLNESCNAAAKSDSMVNNSMYEKKSSYTKGPRLNLNESYTYFKKCQIVFLNSTLSFFIQLDDFDSEIARIQPDIDNCLEPYDSTESALCIGQFAEDEQFYRCRILNWIEETNEASCFFIDFGNTELVSLETITKMSDSLKKVKPLAVHCKLKDYYALDSNEYMQLTELVLKETLFDMKVKTSDLACFYSAKNFDYGAITVELCTSQSNVMINEETLNQKVLWDTPNSSLNH